MKFGKIVKRLFSCFALTNKKSTISLPTSRELGNKHHSIMTLNSPQTKSKIRLKLEQEFEQGKNMDKCIKLLSLTDDELQNEPLMTLEEDTQINEYSSLDEDN